MQQGRVPERELVPWEVARTLQQVEGSLSTGGYSMGSRSLGDRQDRIICGFHHGGAQALTA